MVETETETLRVGRMDPTTKPVAYVSRQDGSLTVGGASFIIIRACFYVVSTRCTFDIVQLARFISDRWVITDYPAHD